jgi:hypothetical protein
MYELPFGKGRQWLKSSPVVGGILGGWNVNTITLLETGPYLTPTDSISADQTNTDPAGDGSVVRPDRVGNPIPANRSPGNYFDFNAFAHTPLNAGRVGNAGVEFSRRPVRSQSVQVWRSSLPSGTIGVCASNRRLPMC